MVKINRQLIGAYVSAQFSGSTSNHFFILRDMMVAYGSRYGQEVYLCAVPLCTNFGLTATLNLCMYTGGTLVLHERWSTDKNLTDIEHYRAIYFGGTPTMYVYMVNDCHTARHDLSSLRVCTTGGSPVPQPVIRRFEEISGVKVAQVYGATETCGKYVIEPITDLRRARAAGLPVGPTRILIVDEGGAPMEKGQTGDGIGLWSIGLEIRRSGISGRGWVFVRRGSQE